MSRSRNSKWHISWILLGCYFLVATKRISYSRKLHAVTRRITRLKRRKTAEKRNADSKHAPKDFVIADARSEYSASHRSGNFTVKRRIPIARFANCDKSAVLDRRIKSSRENRFFLIWIGFSNIFQFEKYSIHI